MRTGRRSLYGFLAFLCLAGAAGHFDVDPYAPLTDAVMPLVGAFMFGVLATMRKKKKRIIKRIMHQPAMVGGTYCINPYRRVRQ